MGPDPKRDNEPIGPTTIVAIDTACSISHYVHVNGSAACNIALQEQKGIR
jgi:hypothetical protein